MRTIKASELRPPWLRPPGSLQKSDGWNAGFYGDCKHAHRVQVSDAIRRESRTGADRPGTEARTRQSRQCEAPEHRGRFPTGRPTCRSIQSPKTMSLSKRVQLVRNSSSSVHYPPRAKTKLCQSAQSVARESRFSVSWAAQKSYPKTSGENAREVRCYEFLLNPKRILQKRRQHRRQRRATKTIPRGHSYQRMIERRTFEERQEQVGL